MDPLGAVALPGQRGLERVAVARLACRRRPARAGPPGRRRRRRRAAGCRVIGQILRSRIDGRAIRRAPAAPSSDDDERRARCAAARSRRAARPRASAEQRRPDDDGALRRGCAGRAAGRSGRPRPAATTPAPDARPRAGGPVARLGLARGRSAALGLRAPPAAGRAPCSAPQACRASCAAARAPASPDFSGWNWVAAQRPALDRGHERLAVASVVTRDAGRAGVDRVGARTSGRSRSGCPAASPANSTRAGRRRRPCSSPCAARPAASQPVTAPGSRPRPLVTTPCSSPYSKRICMPTQMPSTGAAGGDPLGDHRPGAERVDAGHAGRVRADAGHDQAVGAGRRVEVGGDRHVGADPGQRPLGRAQVARAVVEHDHRLRHAVPSDQPEHAAGRGQHGGRARRRCPMRHARRRRCWRSDDHRRRRRTPAERRAAGSAVPRSQHALGAGHDAGVARVDRARLAQRPGHRLELRLDDVVRVGLGAGRPRAAR